MSCLDASTPQALVLDPQIRGLALVERWIELGYVAGLSGRLRVRPVTASPGHVRFTCAVDEGHANFVGLVHGGVTAALVDIAGGAAAFTLLERGESLLTTDLTTRFLRPAPITEATLIAEGRVRYHDRRRVVAEVEIVSGGQIVALGSVAVTIRAANAS